MLPLQQYLPRPGMMIRTFIALCFVLLITLFLFPKNTLAHPLASDVGPTYRVSAGFDARYRDGNWIPIQVFLRNDGPDFNGSVSLDVPASFSGIGNQSTLSTYQEKISLPAGAQKQVTLFVPFFLGLQGGTQTLKVNLLDGNGNKLSTQPASLHAVGPGDIFVGILSSQPATSFAALGVIPLPNPGSSVITQPLNTSTFPVIAEPLNNFDLLILDNFATSSLSKEQLTALQNWIRQGGSLITVGGPEWRNTLSPLPADLLPVTVDGTTTLPKGTLLLPFSGQSSEDIQKKMDTLKTQVIASTAKAAPGSTVLLSAGSTPIMVQAPYGQGQVCYLAFDPTLEPVVSWSQASLLWRALLLRNVGDQMLSTSPGTNVATTTGALFSDSSDSMATILRSLFPNSFLAVWLILALLLGYILMLGPIRVLIIRRLKSRDWSWRIVLSTIAVFSLLSYGLALQQKGTSILSSSISVLQLDRPTSGSTTAHVTTYVGVYVPNEGDFSVHIPGFSLVQPASDPLRRPGIGSAPTRITSTQNGTDITLRSVNIWSLRTLVSKHDRQMQGAIDSQLTLNGEALRGTVTNRLPYNIKDAYILTYGYFIPVGNLTKGETKQVSATLRPTSINPTTTFFADQIAASKRINLPLNSSQPPNETQRRIAMLAALSGENPFYNCNGTFCPQPGMITANGVIIRGGSNRLGLYRQILNGGDPLLIPNTSATIIGWADRPAETSEAVTINNSYTSQAREALIQAPLDLKYSGTINLPSPLVNSYLADVQSQGTGVQTVSPGIYAITSGSLTFEFVLPPIPDLEVGTFVFSIPSNINGGTNFTQRTSDTDRLHPQLYNWQTRSWDEYDFNAFSFAVSPTNPYIGPGGRILLQLSNQDASQGTAVFGKPSLELNSASTSTK
jgi:hypothetical protein